MSSLLEEPIPQRNPEPKTVSCPTVRTFGRAVQGQHTDLVISIYTDRILIVLTQLRKLGTVLEITRDTVRKPAEGSSGRAIFSVNTLLGVEREEQHLLARILAEKLDIKKPVLLTLAVKQLNNQKIKDLVQFVLDKF